MAGSVSYRGSRSTAGGTSSLGRFFRWWWRELSALLPAGLRPYPRSARAFVWIEFQPDVAIVRRMAGERLDEIGRIDLGVAEPAARKLAFNALLGRLGRHPVGISVPASQALRKNVALPLAARDNLRQVLGFELARHTPFNVEQAWFDFRETGADMGQGTLGAQLVVAARRPIEAGLAHLREWGVTVHAVAPDDEIVAEPRYANLLPTHLRPATTWPTRLLYVLLAVIPVVLLAAALALPLWQKREVAIALNQETSEAKTRAAVIDALRGELDRASAEYQFLLEQKYRRPPAVAVVEDVTRVLPDETWLTQLEIKGEDVVMSGEAKSASNLVRLMERSTLLQDAGFRSPLLKGRNNVERFQMGAKFRPVDLAAVQAALRAELDAKAKKSRPKAKGGPR